MCVEQKTIFRPKAVLVQKKNEDTRHFPVPEFSKKLLIIARLLLKTSALQHSYTIEKKAHIIFKKKIKSDPFFQLYCIGTFEIPVYCWQFSPFWPTKKTRFFKEDGGPIFLSLYTSIEKRLHITVSLPTAIF